MCMCMCMCMCVLWGFTLSLSRTVGTPTGPDTAGGDSAQRTAQAPHTHEAPQ